MKPTIVTNWDSMPPEVHAGGEVFSTRVLAARYLKMEQALMEIKDRSPDNPWINKIINDAMGVRT